MTQATAPDAARTAALNGVHGIARDAIGALREAEAVHGERLRTARAAVDSYRAVLTATGAPQEWADPLERGIGDPGGTAWKHWPCERCGTTAGDAGCVEESGVCEDCLGSP